MGLHHFFTCFLVFLWSRLSRNNGMYDRCGLLQIMSLALFQSLNLVDISSIGLFSIFELSVTVSYARCS